jgi:hypothetical protein
MGILDRSLGHPANWLDVAIAQDNVADRWLVLVNWEVTMTVVDGHGVCFGVICTMVPSAFSPHAGKKKVQKVRQGYVQPGRPLSELFYAALWECESIVALIWPIGVVAE